jgi:hypothetical protein
MSANATETKYIKTQMSDEEPCLFVTNHGRRPKATSDREQI